MFPDDQIRLTLEYPTENTVNLRGSVLRAGGWAIAQSGVREVHLWIDGRGPYSAHYGLLREEIGSLYDSFSDAQHSGFLLPLPTTSSGPGEHEIRVVCHSRAGHSTQISSKFTIDTRSEYDMWSRLDHLNRDQLIDLF